MKTLKKVLKITGFVVGGLAVALTVTVAVLYRRTHDAPLPAVVASSDPAVIARGRYLVYGPAHCASCHGDQTRKADIEAGREVPLVGGLAFDLPLGTVRPPNITPDVETGIGGVPDAVLARALRHGVRRDGRALLPFMPFADLSDDDLAAILSYLRAQPPVRHAVETRAPTLLGYAVMALVIEPVGPSMPVNARAPQGPTVERGRYLAHAVANCVGCHSKRDLRTGAFVGAPFAGGLEMDSADPATKFVTPNLTPDPKTGRIAAWTEEVFVARFRTGRGAAGSHMPWTAFGTMSDDDLRAVYRYLRTVPPVENDTGPSVSTPAPQTASVTAR